MSALQGGGKRGHRIDAEGAAGGHLVTGFHATQEPITGDDFTPAQGSNGYIGVQAGAMVRRLTPTECERLQALPDGHTLLAPSDDPNPKPDGPRYAACGDAVTASVAEWLGKRIMEADHA